MVIVLWGGSGKGVIICSTVIIPTFNNGGIFRIFLLFWPHSPVNILVFLLKCKGLAARLRDKCIKIFLSS